MSQHINLNYSQQSKLLKIARTTLELALSNKDLILEGPSDPALSRRGFGVFVSLHLESELRGCIGCFESSEQLWKTVANYALAASKDSRFVHDPVTKDELKGLKIEISILHPLQKIQKYTEAELGKHGIVVEKGINRGVLLPQVAMDSGWNLEEFWGYCSHYKAGLEDDSFMYPNVNLYVFETEVFGESHDKSERSLAKDS